MCEEQEGGGVAVVGLGVRRGGRGCVQGRCMGGRPQVLRMGGCVSVCMQQLREVPRWLFAC